MGKTFLLFELVAMILLGFWTQDVHGEDSVVTVSLCELQSHPELYSGKLVKVRAGIRGDLKDARLTELLIAEPCFTYLNIIVELPEGVRPTPSFELTRDKAFKEYLDALGSHLMVQATLEGRFDVTFKWQDRKRVRIGEGKGFGKGNVGDARLVLRRVSDVEKRPFPPRL